MCWWLSMSSGKRLFETTASIVSGDSLILIFVGGRMKYSRYESMPEKARRWYAVPFCPSSSLSFEVVLRGSGDMRIGLRKAHSAQVESIAQSRYVMNCPDVDRICLLEVTKSCRFNLRH